jgi:hypothetical protein
MLVLYALLVPKGCCGRQVGIDTPKMRMHECMSWGRFMGDMAAKEVKGFSVC